MPTAEWLTTMRVGREATWGTPATCTYVIPLLNNPTFNLPEGTAIHAGHVRDGFPMKQGRYSGTGRRPPNFSGAQTPCTAKATQWLMACFAQSTQTCLAAADLTQQFDYATAPVNGSGHGTPGVPYTFQKVMNASATNSLEMAGGLVTRLALDAPQLGSAVYTFDAIGEDIAQPGSIVGSPTVLTDTVLCTKDATWKWAGTSRVPISFNLEFKNNGYAVWKKSITPVAVMRGILEVTGSATFDWITADAWASAALNQGTQNWEIIWGTTTNDGYLYFALDGKIIPTPAQAAADGVEGLTLNFEGMLKAASAKGWEVKTNTATDFAF